MALDTRWILGLACVVFDVDTGQRVDALCPPAVLTEEEKQAVAFHSFPDSMSLELHAKTSVRDTCFWFRIKRTHGTRLPAGSQDGQGAPKTTPLVDTYLYGYVFCRQRQDETLRRGGEQVSVVVLSEHPFSSVLRPLSQIAGPLVLSAPKSSVMLQQVYNEVLGWSNPTAQASMQLLISFNTLTARLPAFDTLPHPSCSLAVDNGLNRRSSSQLSSREQLTSLAGNVRRRPSNTSSLLNEGSVRNGSLLGGTSSSQQLLSRQSQDLALSPTEPQAKSGSLLKVELTSRKSSAPALADLDSGSLASQPKPSGDGSAAATVESQSQVEDLVQEYRAMSAPIKLSPIRVPASVSAPATMVQSGEGPGSGGNVASGQSSQRPVRSLDPGSAFSSGSPTVWGAHLPGTSQPGITLRSMSRGSLHSLDSQNSGPFAQLDMGPPSHSGPSSGLGLDPHATTRAQPSSSSTHNHGGQSQTSAPQQPSAHSSAGQVPLGDIPVPATMLVLPQQQGPSHFLVSSPASTIATPPGSGSNPLQRRMSTSILGGGDSNSAAPGAFNDADIFTPLQPHLSKLWQLWELVLLSRPLLVVAPSPADCSAAVAALISLIAPLPYAPDFRPYYTIHDAAFGALAAGALPGPQQRSVPCMLGCTNLYILKSLSHWPNVLSVGKKESGNAWALDTPQPTSLATMLGAAGAVKALRQRAQGAQALLGEHVEAVWSTYKPVTKPDQTLLVRLLQPKQGDAKSKLQRIAQVNSEALRRHFHELMTDFLRPFRRYFEVGPDEYLPPYDRDELLFTLRYPPVPHSGMLFERVGKAVEPLVELYSRFVSSVNFRDWFTMHRQRLQHLERPVSLSNLLGPSGGTVGLTWFAQASKHLQEVELIQMYQQLEGQLREAMSEIGAAACEAAHLGGGDEDDAVASVRRLQQELVTLFLGIGQEDLQLLCISAPSRRDLLLTSSKQVCNAEQLAQIKKLTELLS